MKNRKLKIALPRLPVIGAAVVFFSQPVEKGRAVVYNGQGRLLPVVDGEMRI